MITGFNTDIDYRGTTFHVQTEDKGVDNPIIESLIYKGGEILGSRRRPYSDILQDGSYDEKIIVSLMEEQHREVMQEVKNGKFFKDNLLADESSLSDQSLDQVILNYLAQSKGEDDKP